jgi:hypothetical protein
MTTCQLITIDYDEEMKNTRKLLERIPLDDGAAATRRTSNRRRWKDSPLMSRNCLRG